MNKKIPVLKLTDRPTGVAGGRLLADAVLARGAAAAGARPQRLQAVGLARAVRHPPRPHHHHHAGRLLRHLLLLLRLTLSGALHLNIC